MKKIRIIVFLTIVFLSIFAVRTYAANNNIVVELDSKYESGKNGKITISLNCEDLIGVVSGKIVTDNLINIEANGTNGWTGTYNNETKQFNFFKAAGSKSNAIGEFTFTIKDSVEDDFNISFEEIELTTPEPYTKIPVSGFEKTIKIKDDYVEVVSLKDISITKNPDKIQYVEGDMFDKTGMVVTAIYSDGSKKIITNYNIFPIKALTLEDKNFIITYTEDDITKETTGSIIVSKKSDGNNIPGQTGNENEGKEDEKNNDKIEDKNEIKDEGKVEEGSKDESNKDGTQVPSDMPTTGTGKVIACGIGGLMAVSLVSYVFSKREG